MSSAAEIAKFFLNKNWPIFALSVICGFLTTVFIIPAEWKNNIPFENKDFSVIALIIVISLSFYLFFHLIYYIYRKISYIRLNKESEAFDARQEKENIMRNLDYWDENSYQTLMRLITNNNDSVKTFLTYDGHINPRWFKIETVQESSTKTKKKYDKPHQEISGFMVLVSLKPEIYKNLKQIYNEEGTLTNKYRPIYNFNEESKETK